jgi:hypothetical protein
MNMVVLLGGWCSILLLHTVALTLCKLSEVPISRASREYAIKRYLAKAIDPSRISFRS